MNLQQAIENQLTENEAARVMAIAEDEQSVNGQNMVVEFAGYRDGKAIGLTSDGQEIQVELKSNGSIQNGQVIIAVRGSGDGTLYGFSANR